MTKYLVIAAVLALSLAGCQKQIDLGRVQEESLELVKVHNRVLDGLQRRADNLLGRGRSVGAKAGPNAQGIADAGRILTEARAQLDQLKGMTAQAPAAVVTAAKTGNEEELYKTSDELVEKLDEGESLVRADLDAVDNWLAFAESRPAGPAAAATPPLAPPVTESPVSPPAAPPTAPGGARPADPTTP